MADWAALPSHFKHFALFLADTTWEFGQKFGGNPQSVPAPGLYCTAPTESSPR